MLTVDLIADHYVITTVSEGTGDHADLLDTVGLVVDGHHHGQPCLERSENVQGIHFPKVAKDKIRRRGSTVDDDRFCFLYQSNKEIEAPWKRHINEIGVAVKAFESRIFVVGIHRPMREAEVFVMLDEVDCKGAFADTAFAVHYQDKPFHSTSMVIECWDPRFAGPAGELFEAFLGWRLQHGRPAFGAPPLEVT